MQDHDNNPLEPVRQLQFWSALRAAPIFVPAFALFNLLYHPSEQALNLLLGAVVSHFANQLAKYLFRYLYGIPWLEPVLHRVLGRGSRPDGACNSSSFLVYPNKPATTYGMPSGHSQTAWFLATYITATLYLNQSISDIHRLVASVIVIGYAFLVSYSRVYIDKVHTLQQVVLGGILGVLIGLLFV
jgi:membrane-associated phospholipid phosphatase